MKKNIKGFTLIELLAVIIILAVIALIATPIVLDVINDAKKSGAKDSAYGVIESGKLYYAEQYMKNNGSFTDYECTFSNATGCDELSIAGAKPKVGNLSVTQNGVINGVVEFNGYTLYICDNNVYENSSDCNVVEYDKIYAINSEGVITGFKTKEISLLDYIIPKVYALDITDEASNYVSGGIITIPEYVGNTEVTGIGDNAFSAYAITEVRILSNKQLTIGANAFPSNIKLKVNECYKDKYNMAGITIETIPSSVECDDGKYKESILNGAIPELYTGLIPVTIEPNGTVKVADVYTEWYNYTDKKWANAVTVNNETYRTAEAGTTIPGNAINGYYVWIPRYKYQLFNVEGNIVNPQEINIVFENKNTKKSNGSTNGEYLTPQAFTFDTKELNGFWCSKYEASGSVTNVTNVPGAQANVYAGNMSSMFMASRNMEKAYNNFGFISESGDLNLDGTYTTKNNGLDTHFIKSGEWGATAYLAQSKYGRCTNGVCTEVSQNGSYNSTGAGGVGCSTTGNITGVYDMNGGTAEFAMGSMKDANGNFVASSTGFTTEPNAKYYDSYVFNDVATDFSKLPLGDATKETRGWYGDLSISTSSGGAWNGRGGYYYATDAGIFHYGFGNGLSDNWNGSFRVSITAE